MSRAVAAKVLLGLTALAALIELGPVARAEPPSDLPLRRRFPLIPLIADASVSPPFDKRDLDEPCRAESYVNPYSPLAKPLKNRHRRVTAGLQGAKVELRDAFLVDLPRALTFELVAPAEARLDFGYRLYPCSGGKAKGKVVVTLEDALGTTTRVLPLTKAKGKKGGWQDVSLELPVAANQPMRMTVAFETDAKPGELLLAWAEPAVSGRPEAASLADTNVLWVVIDAVRSDALGPSRRFGPETPSPTPAMDEVFARGTSFTKAYSMGNQTRTSTTAMIAAVHPSIGGFHSHDWAFARGKLARWYDASPPLVTRLLEEDGWRVAHYGHNFFLWGSDPVGIDAGFPKIVDFRSIPSDAPQASEWAIRWFEDHRDERWFLMLNYTAPHTPYKAPEEWDRKARELPGPERLGGTNVRSYIGEIMWVDHNIGPVFEALDRLDLTKKTLVIITADHGEVMLPWHDCIGWEGERCGFNHSWTLYDDETNVPLVFALPERVGAGVVIDTPVSHVDVAPTILDLLGQPPGPGMGGRSIRPALEGRPVEPTPVYIDGRRAAAARIGDWKLILHAADDTANPIARHTDEDGPFPKHELFDLANDPDERTNLVRAKADVMPSLLARLNEIRTLLAERYATRTPPVTAPAGSDAPQAAEPGAATPLASATAASDPDAGAENRLMLVAGPVAAPLVGTIRAVGGTIRCGAPLPDGVTCTPAGTDGIRVELTAKAEREAIVPFVSAPWATPLDFDLSAPWAPSGRLAADRLRLGAWGLALLPPGAGLDTDARLALAARRDVRARPIPQPNETAVYFWRSPFVAASATSVSGDPRAGKGNLPATFVAPEDQVADPHAEDQLGSEMRKVLKDLGYTH